MRDNPTIPSVLTVELSTAVFARLEIIETMSRTAVSNSAQVLEIAKDLKGMFEELRSRIDCLEKRISNLEG